MPTLFAFRSTTRMCVPFACNGEGTYFVTQETATALIKTRLAVRSRALHHLAHTIVPTAAFDVACRAVASMRQVTQAAIVPAENVLAAAIRSVQAGARRARSAQEGT